MAKANVNPDAIEKITELIQQTEKNITELNVTLSETYSTLLEVENAIAHLQRVITRAESMLKPDATENIHTLYTTQEQQPTGDNTLD